MSDDYTPEEMALLEAASKDFTTLMPEEKFNLHSFLNKVLESPDTTRIGYLDTIEIGMPQFSTRTLKDNALISKKIIGNQYFEEYFLAESENITSTSLSKDAKLINLSTESKKMIENIKKPRKQNKGWFKKNGAEDVA